MITVNGKFMNASLSFKILDKHHINIYATGSDLSLSTDFGLNVNWKGEAVLITISDVYAGYTCGLCGNADGKFNLIYFLLFLFNITLIIF